MYYSSNYLKKQSSFTSAELTFFVHLGDCPVNCRMSSMTGLWPLSICSTTLAVTTKNVSRCLGTKLPLVRITSTCHFLQPLYLPSPGKLLLIHFTADWDITSSFCLRKIKKTIWQLQPIFSFCGPLPFLSVTLSFGMLKLLHNVILSLCWCGLQSCQEPMCVLSCLFIISTVIDHSHGSKWLAITSAFQQ